jgi:tetratricopeptide (TPR) repeat protein
LKKKLIGVLAIVDFNFKRAKELFDGGKYSEVISILQNIDGDSTNCLDEMYFMYFSYARLSRFDIALKGFRKLLQLGYNGYDSYYSYFIYNIGLCYYKTLQFRKAYLFFKYALACCNRLEFIPRTLQTEEIIFHKSSNHN